MEGYASDTGMAPSINTPGIGDYLTARTVVLAHAKIYRMYETEFKDEQQGRPPSKSFCDKKPNTKFNKPKIRVNFNPPIAESNYSRRRTRYLPDRKKRGGHRWS
jgi:hypothetical protein